MAFANPSDEMIKQILSEAKTIAVVGLSDKKDRISYLVAEVLQRNGYKIVPVNPSVQGEILGETCYASLTDIPFAVDLVNVFRRSEYTPEIAQEAVQIEAKTLWLQLGIYSEEAAEIAIDHGLSVIMDRCIKVELSRLLSRG